MLIKVAKLMTSVPAGQTKSAYLSQLSIQIVEVLKFALHTKDFVMQKVCVLIVTRVSHLSSDICCEHVLRPLSSPLLMTNKEHHSRTVSANTSGYIQMRGTESALEENIVIESAVCALHALVTLCPLQTPLMIAIQRSGVGMAAIALLLFLLSEEKCRTLPLLSMLKEISFILLKTSSDPRDFANQMLKIVVHSGSNKYSVSAEGILSIRHSTSIRTRQNNNSSAEQLVSQLGLSAPGSVGVWNPAVVSSPSDLLAAMRHQDQHHNDTASASTSTSTSAHPCVGSERDRGSGPGRDVEDILSMAATAALELERAASDRLPRSDRDILQGIQRTLGQTLDRGDESGMDEDEEGSEGVVGDGLECEGTSAHTMLAVSVRAKAVAELLLLFEQHMGRGREGGDNSHDSLDNAQSIEESMRQNNRVQDEKEEDEVEGVVAEFFLRCLETFLSDQSSMHLRDHSSSPEDLIPTGLFAPTKSSSAVTSVPSLKGFDKGLCGLVMIVMQAHIPIESLLGGGE